MICVWNLVIKKCMCVPFWILETDFMSQRLGGQ